MEMDESGMTACVMRKSEPFTPWLRAQSPELKDTIRMAIALKIGSVEWASPPIDTFSGY